MVQKDIIALHKQGAGYKKIAKELNVNVPRDTVGSWQVQNLKEQSLHYLDGTEIGSCQLLEPDF